MEEQNDGAHSSFLSWQLTPRESHGMGDFPMRRFLETVCFAYMKYGAEYLSAKNPSYQEYCKRDTVRQKAADSKLLFFQGPSPSKEQEKLRDALMLGDYRIASCGVAREHILTAKRRADIYIDAMLDVGGTLSHILILIENKVHSDENDSQSEVVQIYSSLDDGGTHRPLILCYLSWKCRIM
ncbi:MAG: PD-(D/E)XK nuclease family protein [Roseburia sp.]|nr:PD-(D/E)XK nuclease family protein [Lachnospiraceae bacterium]MCM1568882.1 PD-(D/E)XK nuclease family protein [Roseburia sp.]